MKERRVIVTIEVETDATFKQLKDGVCFSIPDGKTLVIEQIQTNVIQD